MSWSLTIKASEPLTEDMIHAALTVFLGGEPDKQAWGWSCGVDVGLPSGNTLNIRGADYSWGRSQTYADGIARELKRQFGITCSIPLGDE